MKKIKIIQLENDQLSQKAMTEITGGIGLISQNCRCTLYEWGGSDTASNTEIFPPGPGPGPGPDPGGPTCICFTYGSPGSYGDSANDNLSF